MKLQFHMTHYRLFAISYYLFLLMLFIVVGILILLVVWLYICYYTPAMALAIGLRACKSDIALAGV